MPDISQQRIAPPEELESCGLKRAFVGLSTNGTDLKRLTAGVLRSEFRSCVKVEVAVLGFPS